MDQLYNTRRLNQIFVALNLTALAFILITIYKDQRPEWYPYQTTYIQLFRQYAQQELNRVQKELQGDAEYQQLKKQLQEVSAKLNANPHYKELSREVARLNEELKKVQTQLSEVRLDYLHYEDEYFWARSQSAKERYRRLMQQLKPTVDKLTAQMEDIQARLLKVTEEFNALDKERQELQKKLSEKEFALQVAQASVESAQKAKPKIQQIHNPELHLVDRCTTCHMGYDKPESWGEFLKERIAQLEKRKAPKASIDILKALMPHPRQQELFAKHPVSKFGCTSCHGGQGVALKKDVAHAYNEKFWETPMLPIKYVEAGCGKCHRYEMTLAGAPKLSRGKQLYYMLGCFGCHDAKGYEDVPEDLQKIGPSLTHIATKTSPEWLFRWLKNPHAWSPNTRMPMFYLRDDEAWALVAYLRHATEVVQGEAKPQLIDLEPHYGKQPLRLTKRYPGGDPTRGRQLVQQVGCLGCHRIDGVGGPQEREKGKRVLSNKDFGPNLSKVGSKITNPDWLFNWLLNPKAIDPKAKMPNLRLSDQEAADITAFLLTLREQPTARPVAFTPTPQLDNPELIDKGFRLIANYGCAGCHNIPGTEKLTKIGKNLSDEADLDPHLIDFGQRVHEIFEKAPTYWDRKYIWLREKILRPRSFREQGLRMPNPNISEEDADALLTAILSFTKREVATLKVTATDLPQTLYVRDRADDPRIAAISAGQKLVFSYNCVGCHIVEGYGGDIWPLLEDGMQPPNLQSEGYRVNHDWLFRFLHDPTMGSGRQHYIRPWLKVRMPTFGFDDGEVNTLIRYFAALDNRPIFQEFRTPYRPNPATAAVGKKLFDALQCMACHPTGPVQPGADVAQLAPNLQLTRERLQPEWIVDWLLDPQKFQPGTRMPTFFPYNEQTGKHDSPMPDILGGDARKQAEALRDYLLTLAPPTMAKRP
ncbi:MAG: hypothetical protein HZLCBSQH_000064 [Candidatus Fervidibacterota bacterium]